MDSNDMQELYALAASRRLAQRESREIDRRIGQLAAHMIEDGVDRYTKLKIGDVLGVSHTTVATLISAARQAQEDTPQERVTRMYARDAVRYVQAQKASLRRVVAGFAEQDVLDASEIDPRLFQSGGWYGIPNMIWQLDTGEWIGLQDVNVGYGGTGCGNGQEALHALGYDDEIAAAIVAPRFVDAPDVSNPRTWTTSKIWPRYPRPVPRVVHEHVVFDWFEPAPYTLEQRNIDPTGYLASTPDTDELSACIDLLDNPLPWATGTRRARVFLTGEAAAQQGFIHWRWKNGHRIHSSPQLVIEQGDVQLWCNIPKRTQAERARGQLLPDAAYSILNAANLFSDELVDLERRESSMLARMARTALGRGSDLPRWIDLPSTGHDTIQFLPSNHDQ